MRTVGTYWHTLRHLKPVQFYGRARNALPRLPRRARPAPALAVGSGHWAVPPAPLAALERRGVFRFLNETRDLGCPVDWDAPGASLLWRYNLHYFDALGAGPAKDRAPADVAVDLLAQWRQAHPRGSRPAWDPYPTSLRIVNWIKWVLTGGALSQSAVHSLVTQVRWLSDRPEWHLLGNHLFANAKALVFAGAFFGGREADRWLSQGSAILESQLGEQVLGDGGNFELSPMYHAIFLGDVLDLVNISRRYPGRLRPGLEHQLVACAQAMIEWLSMMVHPDGEIALFNDAAIGIAPTLAALTGYGERLGIAPSPARSDMHAAGCAIRVLPDSGYARLSCDRAVALCDIGRIGPDYLPGHAHADTLSFELSIGGRRVIVNGGTSRYGADAARVRERGTCAHSTVTVDGADSSEVWSGFRVARRARPIEIAWAVDNQGVELRAGHDGYRRLHRDIIHRRRWQMTSRSLRIEDEVSGPWRTAQARYILHSEVQIAADDPGVWLLDTGATGMQQIRFRVTGGEARIEDDAHSLEFGRRLPTKVLVVDLPHGAPAMLTIEWAP